MTLSGTKTIFEKTFGDKKYLGEHFQGQKIFFFVVKSHFEKILGTESTFEDTFRDEK